jgi:hypothetical protein
MNSKRTVEKCSEVWIKNLPSSAKRLKRRSDIPLVDKSLAELVRLPLKKDVIGRFLFLYEEVKERNVRMNRILDELLQLWRAFSFPELSTQVVMDKIKKVLDLYESYRKRNDHKFDDELKKVFDITKSDGVWMCRQDKELYFLQLKSEGKVGYRTDKAAPASSVHPSKRKLFNSACGEGCSSNYRDETQDIYSDESETSCLKVERSSNDESRTSLEESPVKCKVSIVHLPYISMY